MNTKPSMTLRFLEAHAVFTFDEFMRSVDPEVSERTRETNLRNAILRRRAYRITRALYASNIGVYRDVPPNPLLVAGKAAPGQRAGVPLRTRGPRRGSLAGACRHLLVFQQGDAVRRERVWVGAP